MVPPINIWRECTQKIGDYTQETERLRKEISLQEKELRKIDPSLLNEPRYNSDDWVFVQLVKTIYYAVKCYFAAAKVGVHQGKIQEFQKKIKPRETIEKKMTTAFNQAFNLDDGLSDARKVGQQFEKFVRFSEGIDLAAKTNAFLGREELNRTPLAEITARCTVPKLTSSDSDDWSLSCEEEDGVNGVIPPLSLQKLLPARQYAVLAKILPLSMVQSITKLGDKDIYHLTFEGPLEGRIKGVEGNGFAESLKEIILSKLLEGPDPLKKLCEDYTLVKRFLEQIEVSSMEDFTKILYWEGLLGAWKSTEGSLCHLPKEVDLSIRENQVDILAGAFRAGVHVTDYHHIKNHLFNTVMQGACYTLLCGLGFITVGGYTKQPLHSTFSINGMKFPSGEDRIFLQVSENTTAPLSFDYDESWQTPQNLSQQTLYALAASPSRFISKMELEFLGNYLSWSLVEDE